MRRPQSNLATVEILGQNHSILKEWESLFKGKFVPCAETLAGGIKSSKFKPKDLFPGQNESTQLSGLVWELPKVPAESKQPLPRLEILGGSVQFKCFGGPIIVNKGKEDLFFRNGEKIILAKGYAFTLRAESDVRLVGRMEGDLQISEVTIDAVVAETETTNAAKEGTSSNPAPIDDEPQILPPVPVGGDVPVVEVQQGQGQEQEEAPLPTTFNGITIIREGDHAVSAKEE